MRLLSPNPLILETHTPEHGRIVLVAAVEDYRLPHGALAPIEVGMAERLPLGDQRHGVRALDGFVLIGRERQAAVPEPLARQFASRRVHRPRTLRRDARARAEH